MQMHLQVEMEPMTLRLNLLKMRSKELKYVAIPFDCKPVPMKNPFYLLVPMIS